ncbi:MAG: hypothetical protein M3Z32_08050, partial [Acidobacteriota bacterium]|nr:hypothetical protein [Acidobacteriota bacterium]
WRTFLASAGVSTSSGWTTRFGLILLVADLQDLKANPDRPAVGTVLEAKLDRGLESLGPHRHRTPS